MDSQKLGVIKRLKGNYPDAKYYLDFSNPLELMIAAILSAQVRDEIVNAVTKGLFNNSEWEIPYFSKVG